MLKYPTKNFLLFLHLLHTCIVCVHFCRLWSFIIIFLCFILFDLEKRFLLLRIKIQSFWSHIKHTVIINKIRIKLKNFRTVSSNSRGLRVWIKVDFLQRLCFDSIKHFSDTFLLFYFGTSNLYWLWKLIFTGNLFETFIFTLWKIRRWAMMLRFLYVVYFHSLFQFRIMLCDSLGSCWQFRLVCERILFVFFLDLMDRFIETIFIKACVIKFFKDLFWALFLQIFLGWFLAGLKRGLRFFKLLKQSIIIFLLFFFKIYDKFAAFIDLGSKLKGRIDFLLLIFHLFSLEEVLNFCLFCVIVQPLKNTLCFLSSKFLLRFGNIRSKCAVGNFHLRLLRGIFFLKFSFAFNTFLPFFI